ncbi:MAG: tRNA pseudouridine(38-40) synthase TruA [Blautia massiliensis (ex Durand et al. 2017)]
MTWLLWIAYKGTRYAGFQVQRNAPTICAALQDAMQAAWGQRPDVKGCSRTDAGVHARRFALSFCYTGRVPADKMVPALNAHLPPDIRALELEPVPDGFHARYSAHAKTYCYHIRNARVDDPFTVEYCHRVAQPLDLAAMQAAAAQFVGTHDFLALCASGSGVAARGDTVRTISACGVERRGEYLTITVTADGYLYNMVRILAGTLVEAGQHKRTADSIPALLESRDRRKAGPTLPAKGLFLQDVAYPDLGRSKGATVAHGDA